jgi:putative membrane protein
MMGYDGWGWMAALHGLLWLVFVLLVVVAGVALIRYLWRHGSGGGGPAASAGSALRILEERYARGEIDREEFQQRKRDLG